MHGVSPVSLVQLKANLSALVEGGRRTASKKGGSVPSSGRKRSSCSPLNNFTHSKQGPSEDKIPLAVVLSASLTQYLRISWNSFDDATFAKRNA